MGPEPNYDLNLRATVQRLFDCFWSTALTVIESVKVDCASRCFLRIPCIEANGGLRKACFRPWAASRFHFCVACSLFRRRQLSEKFGPDADLAQEWCWNLASLTVDEEASSAPRPPHTFKLRSFLVTGRGATDVRKLLPHLLEFER